MNAYDTQVDSRRSPPIQTAPPAKSGPDPDEGPNKKRPKGKIFYSENDYLVIIALFEFIILGSLIALNYVLRFDPPTRDAGSLFNVANVSFALSDVLPMRPYYDYRLSLSENALTSGASYGISFTMEEYAFFVPFFIFSLLLFVLVEVINFLAFKKDQKSVDSVGLRFHQLARRLLRIYYTFLLFACIAGMVTIFVKLLVAVPRPHFLFVCLGGWDISNLNPSSFLTVGDQCINVDNSALYEALRSFPSYHATIALYSTTYLCLYLFYALRCKGVYCMTSLLSLPVIVMGMIGALHRWTTYHNTFFDIAWGAVIGIVCAYVAVFGFLRGFKERIWWSVKSPKYGSPAASEGTANEGFVPSPPITRTDMVLSKSPSGRPTQAFNTNLGVDEDPRRRNQASYGAPTDYNRPRQRFSIPPPPRAPSAPRPNSAHPMNGYSRSRYEGTSYF